MIELLQLENNLIGTHEAARSLEKKEHARLLVLSDSHGNYRIMASILKNYGPSCDAFIFCGDGITDLAEMLETADTNPDFKKCIPPVIAFVRGNGDPDTFPLSFDIGKHNPNAKGLLKGTLIVPSRQILCVNNTNFYITHGHNEGVYYSKDLLGMQIKYSECSVALFGHTHIAEEEIDGSFKFINPGSCTRPRDGKKPGFAIITVEKDFTDTAFIKIENAFSDNPVFTIQK